MTHSLAMPHLQVHQSPCPFRHCYSSRCQGASPSIGNSCLIFAVLIVCGIQDVFISLFQSVFMQEYLPALQVMHDVEQCHKASQTRRTRRYRLDWAVYHIFTEPDDLTHICSFCYPEVGTTLTHGCPKNFLSTFVIPIFVVRLVCCRL